MSCSFCCFFSYFPTGQKDELCLKRSQIPILFGLRHRNERRIYFKIVTLQYNSRKFLWTRKGAHSDKRRYKPHPLPTGSQDRSGQQGQTLTAHWGWDGPKATYPRHGTRLPSLLGRWSNYVCLGLWLEVTSTSWEKSYHITFWGWRSARVQSLWSCTGPHWGRHWPEPWPSGGQRRREALR